MRKIQILLYDRAAAIVVTLLTLTLGATDARATVRTYIVNWSGSSFSNSAQATGVIRLDDALMENPGANDTSGIDFVPSFYLTITGASSGNGKFGEADFGNIVLYTGSAGLDLTRQLVGQPASTNPWGTSLPGSGEFNLYQDYHEDPSPAPNGSYFFELTTNLESGDRMLVTSFAPLACTINGIVGGNEQCDDGNAVNNDGCTGCLVDDCYVCSGSPSICAPASAGTTCLSDTIECTADQCNGSGVCTHPPKASGTACLADSDACTADQCNGLGACTHPPAAEGTPCNDDGDACTDNLCDSMGACTHPATDCDDANSCTRDRCDTLTGCINDSSPLVDCVTGASASIKLKDNADDAKDQLKWKLSKGGSVEQTDLGNPASTTSYALCVYDYVAGSPTLKATVDIPAGASWTSKAPKGFDYEGDATSDGVTKVQLKTGEAGKSSVSVSAKGAALPMPAAIDTSAFFDQATKVTVQLVDPGTLKCWSSDFTTSSKNEPTSFAAKAP